MYKVFQPIIDLVKIKHFTISDLFFSLNTKFIPIVLLLFSALLTTSDILRTSIDCYVDMTGNGRKAIMDNFCYAVGTYMCKNMTRGCSNSSEDDKIFYRYYQWIAIVFIIQSAILYMPAFLWEVAEGGLMRKICDELGMTELLI